MAKQPVATRTPAAPRARTPRAPVAVNGDAAHALPPPPFDAAPFPEPKAAEPALRTTGRADTRTIRVRGAREHNLKNIDVTIPRDTRLLALRWF